MSKNSKTNKDIFYIRKEKKKDKKECTENYINEKELIDQKNKTFFNEYIKMCEINNVLNYYLKQLLQTKLYYKQYTLKLDQKNSEISKTSLLNDPYINRKRKRRLRKDIKYGHKCTIQGCNKEYTTEGSLKLHQKIKHFC